MHVRASSVGGSVTERLHFEYPDVGNAVEDIAKSYNREADGWDSEAEKDKRLHH